MSTLKDVNPNAVIFVKDYLEEDLYYIIILKIKDQNIVRYVIIRLYQLQKSITPQ